MTAAPNMVEFPQSARRWTERRRAAVQGLLEHAESLGEISKAQDADGSPVSAIMGILTQSHVQQMRMLALIHAEIAQLALSMYEDEE